MPPENAIRHSWYSLPFQKFFILFYFKLKLYYLIELLIFTWKWENKEVLRYGSNMQIKADTISYCYVTAVTHYLTEIGQQLKEVSSCGYFPFGLGLQELGECLNLRRATSAAMVVIEPRSVNLLLRVPTTAPWGCCCDALNIIWPVSQDNKFLLLQT